MPSTKKQNLLASLRLKKTIIHTSGLSTLILFSMLFEREGAYPSKMRTYVEGNQGGVKSE